MLRDPLAAKNFLLTLFGQKINCKTQKTPLEPLDLLDTVGQSCVYVSVSVLVSVCVWCGEERRCGVVTLKSPKKKHISICLHIFLSISN